MIIAKSKSMSIQAPSSKELKVKFLSAKEVLKVVADLQTAKMRVLETAKTASIHTAQSLLYLFHAAGTYTITTTSNNI
jgi:hypothetical protein